MSKRCKVKHILIFLFFVVSLFAKNILIINSYSVKFQWTKTELEGILNGLKDRKDVKIYIEFMDTKVFRPTPERFESFYTYLKNKYKGVKFDIIITTDDNALNFVKKYKNTSLFKDAKVFFAGVNNLKLAKQLDKSKYAGVFEKKEPLANYKFIKKIMPDVKYIYVVADNSNSAKSVMKEYKKAFEKIKDVKFIYINDKNLENVLRELKFAKDKSAMILLTPYSFYLKGSHMDYEYAIALISQYFPHPIVIHTDLLAGMEDSNIVGGKVTDALSQGKEVAKKVLKYLKGEFMQNIGFTFEKANKMYLNVKNLEKFGVDADDLDYKDAVLVNKPLTFYSMYKEWIISLAIIIFGIISITIILLMKNIQLRRYNVKMKDMNKSLENKIEKAIEEIKLKDKEYFNYKNDTFKNIIQSIVFQLKYPIEELSKLDIKNEKAKELVFYLKEKLNKFNDLFNSEKEIFNIEEILKDYPVNGKGFFVNANKEQLKRIIEDIMSLCSKAYIMLYPEKRIMKIYLEDYNPEELQFVRGVLENWLNVEVFLYREGNILIFEIKFN